jgi:hypothetical protein
MANFTTVIQTRTITQNVEYSIAKDANYSSGSPMTVMGYVQAVADISAMVAGDIVEIRFYKSVNGGTPLPLIDPITRNNAQSQHYTIPLQLLASGWDITLKLTTATSRSVKFEVVMDTNDVNAATVGTGAIVAATFAAGAITSTVIAANAIGASQIATDAIDADSIAADAGTEIRTGLATSTALTTAQTDLTTLTGRLTSTRAGLLDNLDTAMTTRAAAATALSTAQWTNARAGYLDNLNIGGNVAASAEVVAIQNNTRVVRVVPDMIERPDTGTQAFRIEVLLYDSTGNMEAPDSAPTIALVNQAGTDLSARLDSTTMALVSTGRYRAVYTAAVADALEQLVWTFSIVEGGATRLYGNTSVIVDTSAVDFTSADRTKLNQLATDYTTARAGGLDALPLLDAAITTRASAGSVATVASSITTLGSAVASVQADTDNIQTRLPTTLDAGAMRSTIDAGALASIGAGILSAVVDIGIDALAAPVNITVIGAFRLLLSEAVGKVSGFISGTPVYRDTADTKARISGTITADGRTAVSVDPT